MMVPENIHIPHDAKEQIKAILPFATGFRPSIQGGWEIRFQIKEDHANWNIDEAFLAANNLKLDYEVDEAHFSPIAGWMGSHTIMFKLTYTPQK